jgi:hypothetical protein
MAMVSRSPCEGRGRLRKAARSPPSVNTPSIVNVQVEAPTEPLRKADRAAAGSRDAPESGLLALPMEHLANEDASDGGQRPVVLGKKQP